VHYRKCKTSAQAQPPWAHAAPSSSPAVTEHGTAPVVETDGAKGCALVQQTPVTATLSMGFVPALRQCLFGHLLRPMAPCPSLSIMHPVRAASASGMLQ